ncbi:MAG: ammonium transporter [Pseudomonadota bacterium]
MRSGSKFAALLLAGLALAGATPAMAQEASAADALFVVDTLFILLSAFLVMWMAAGFTMLEAGFVRSRNVAMQLTKNIGLFALAAASFALVGYGLSSIDADATIPGFLGAFKFGELGFAPAGSVPDTSKGGPADAAVFFYGLMFCATTASIVSGAVAERIKLVPFFIFTILLTGLIYPIQSSWTGADGFLSNLGFVDHAGSVTVHAAGGSAALMGILIIGARIGRFSKEGHGVPMPGSSLPLATLGVFILWLGWFGFNGGATLSAGTPSAMADISRVIVNTNAAACGGAICALVLSQLMYRSIDLTMVLNGTLAGLVAITAEPTHPSMLVAMLIGSVGGALVIVIVPLLDRLRLDDVVGAVPVHLCAGIWGGIAAGLTNPDGSVLAQLVGIAMICGFVMVASGVVWLALALSVGLRFDAETEQRGLDINELGMEAYPDFVTYEDSA